jgi:hypothetical protein
MYLKRIREDGNVPARRSGDQARWSFIPGKVLRITYKQFTCLIWLAEHNQLLGMNSGTIILCTVRFFAKKSSRPGVAEISHCGGNDISKGAPHRSGWHPLQHEPARQLLGQRSDGTLLFEFEDGGSAGD